MLGLLIVISLLWLLLPFVPAIVELKKARDARPLEIAQAYSFDLPESAAAFSRSAYRFMGCLIESPNDALVDPTGGLEGSGCFGLLGSRDELIQSASLPAEVHKLALFDSPQNLPKELAIPGCIYSAHSFLSGSGSRFDAIYSEKDLYLGCESTIRGWAHAKGFLVADVNCRLAGSMRADVQIAVRAGVQFERLSAPSILFGSFGTSGTEFGTTADIRRHGILQAVNAPFIRDDRSVVVGDLTLSRNVTHVGDLVVKGDLVVRSGARFRGNLKCQGYLTVEDNVSIHGHVFSVSGAAIGNDVYVNGVLSVEEELTIGSGSVIGSSRSPSTVVARRLEIEEGVHIIGVAWAIERGVVKQRTGKAAAKAA